MKDRVVIDKIEKQMRNSGAIYQVSGRVNDRTTAIDGKLPLSFFVGVETFVEWSKAQALAFCERTLIDMFHHPRTYQDGRGETGITL